jgi:alkylhydroperoxidase/carboxymuconolactone decarboxylase family protein YurZ
MVGAAIKLHKMCEKGRVVTRNEAREHITAAGRRAGLTDEEIARVIDRLVTVASCEQLAAGGI